MEFKLFVSSFFLTSLILCDPTFAQDSDVRFPYQALVLKDKATVHSGPAAVHYSTDELTVDSVVEVHRHDPGGWCAIRPPAGSFSMVPESAIEKLSEDIGIVTEEGIQAWVGTRLGSVDKPLWQVKLRKDEQVEILGETSWPNPEGYSTIWFQISPPAGEFRWIRISDLRLPKPQTDVPDLAQRNLKSANRIQSAFLDQELAGNVAVAGYQNESDPVFDDEVLDPPSEKVATVNRGWRKATTPIRVADNRIDNRLVKPFKTPAIETPAIAEPTSQYTAPDTSNLQSSALPLKQTVPLTSVSPINGPVSERIRLLDSSLSSEMIKSPDEWDLETLLRQATAISTTSNDINERRNADRMVTKIRNCAEIQSRFENAYKATDNSGLSLTGTVGSGVDNNVEFGTTYDAHGWLNQLIRGRGSLQPTFVLENDEGKIISHVAPAPGLNLNRYVKSKVGIIGRRGYNRDLQMKHVTAERIIVLDKVRR